MLDKEEVGEEEWTKSVWGKWERMQVTLGVKAAILTTCCTRETGKIPFSKRGETKTTTKCVYYVSALSVCVCVSCLMGHMCGTHNVK